MKSVTRARIIALGYPKAGKTGMLAGLVNSGRFEVGLLDFDGNCDPLASFVKLEYYDRVSIKTLEDKLRDDGTRISVSGQPTAFRDALRTLDHWVDDEGRDWGAVRDWRGGAGSVSEPARILVCDTLTSMGEAAFRRRRFVRPSGSKADDTDSDWGAAMRDQGYMMEMLAQEHFQCHVLVNSHIKEISPRLPRKEKGEDAGMTAAKQKLFMDRVEGFESRKCPSALGQALPPEIARFFPAVILVDGNYNDTGKRKIVTSGVSGVDLGVPAPHIAKVLPLETGLLTVIDAILQNGNGEPENE